MRCLNLVVWLILGLLPLPSQAQDGVEEVLTPRRIAPTRSSVVTSTTSTTPSVPLSNPKNGPVLLQTSSLAIFWGTSWSNPTFAQDKITGTDSFLYGIGGSGYAKIASEYYDSAGTISGQNTHNGHVFDPTPVPSSAPLTDAQALKEVCKMTSNNPDPNGIYFLLADNFPGQRSFCAWHTSGKCSNGKKVNAVYIPDLDNWYQCDVKDTSGLHSESMAAVANLLAHEYMETITDPLTNGWTDSNGAYGGEIGDKCAWTFLPPGSLVTLTNGSQWKIQGEWSNAAYATGYGLQNRSGQSACIFSAVDSALPSVPTSLTAVPDSLTQVLLSWNPSTTNGGPAIESYGIFENGVGVATVPGSANNYVLGGLHPGTGYRFSILATNNDQVISGLSTQVAATTYSAPVITLATPRPLPSSTFIGQLKLTFTVSDPSGIQSVTLNGVSENPGNFTDTISLNPGTNQIVVVATDNSPIHSVTTNKYTINYKPDLTAPTVPTGLSATAASATQINLKWTGSTDSGGSGMKGYRLYRNGAFLKAVGASPLSYSDTTTVALTQYTYSVSAIDNAGNESAQSASVSITSP